MIAALAVGTLAVFASTPLGLAMGVAALAGTYQAPHRDLRLGAAAVIAVNAVLLVAGVDGLAV